MNTSAYRKYAPAARQRGAVLFFGLMLLIIIALCAITSSSTALLQERMVGGLRNQQLALMAGETAQRAAEAQLWTAAASGHPVLACGSGSASPLFGVYCYVPSASNTSVHTFRTSTNADKFKTDSAAGVALSSANGVDLTSAKTADQTSQVAQTPYFIIEDLGLDRPPNTGSAREYSGNGAATGAVDKHIFRVTARSVGGTSSVMRIVESTFVAKVN